MEDDKKTSPGDNVKMFDKKFHDMLKSCRSIIDSYDSNISKLSDVKSKVNSFYNLFRKKSPVIFFDLFKKFYSSIARDVRLDFPGLLVMNKEPSMMILNMNLVSEKSTKKIDLREIHSLGLALRKKFAPVPGNKSTPKKEYKYVGELELNILETIKLVCPLDDKSYIDSIIDTVSTEYKLKKPESPMDGMLNMSKQLMSKFNIDPTKVGSTIKDIMNNKETKGIINNFTKNPSKTIKDFTANPSKVINALSKILPDSSETSKVSKDTPLEEPEEVEGEGIEGEEIESSTSDESVKETLTIEDSTMTDDTVAEDTAITSYDEDESMAE